MRNINKVGSRFRFVVEFETATRLHANEKVVVTWERKGIVMATEPVKVDRTTRSANFTGQKLTQVITLFKPKKAGFDFDEKAYRISVRLNGERGKVIGRIDLNFADYVKMPEYSKRLVAKLSHDGDLILRVTSTYMGEAKKSKRSDGSSSVSSATVATGASDSGNENTTMFDLDDQSDMTDLELPDIEPPHPDPPAPKPERKALAQSQSRKDRRRAHNRTSSTSQVAPSRSRRQEREPSPSSTSSLQLIPTVSAMDDSVPSRAKAGSGVRDEGGSRPTVPRADYDKLRRENRALMRKNNDLLTQNDELEEKLAATDLHGASDRLQEMEDEIDALTRENRELQSRLGREPVYADVVRQLKDAKMALAILSQENAEMKSRRR